VGRVEADGRFDGSAPDRDDGYIHCSSREQVAGTAARYFADEPALVVAAIDTEVVSAWLRWEPSPTGGRFPHVYAPLPLNAVAAVHRVAGASSVDAALPPE
jgi:uncharacterized protein (DUF952 family)